MHLLLGNNKNALEDSMEALKLDKDNLKVSINCEMCLQQVARLWKLVLLLVQVT